jgi:hypothetical protein
LDGDVNRVFVKFELFDGIGQLRGFGFGFAEPPLMPPWTHLRKRGKSAMDGAFSLSATGCRVETTRLEQVSPRLARRAASSGCISLVTFFVQAKKVTRPYQSCFVRRIDIETGETMPAALNGEWVFSPVLT